jgi:PAS domain S-box-containing protein
MQAGWLGLGLAWSLGAVLLLPQAAPGQFGALALALAVLAGGSFVIGTVDLVALALRLQGPGLRAASAGHPPAPDPHPPLAALLQALPQGYWLIDPQGRCTDANPALCVLLGRPREAILGHHAIDFCDGDDEMRQRVAQRACAAGGTDTYEITVARPDGTRVHCLNTATPLSDPQGRTLGAVGLWTDITGQRQAEASLRVYERLVNALTEVVSVVDEQQRYHLVNDEWCLRTGIAREQVIGRTWASFLPTVTAP